MYDRFGRKINYLRVSVTDLCNLRCDYCMPAEGVKKLPHHKILSLEEIAEVVRIAAELGVDKVRITGGEPLVRKGIVSLVAMIRAIPQIRDLAMTTNGVLLPRYAQDLRQAGLDRLNISLDTLDPQRFRQITRIGNLEQVIAGIHAAIDAGFTPIKLNCVIDHSPDEKDARDVAEFARHHNLQVRFIRKMDTQSGKFWQVIGGEGGHCAACNRLRLTADGRIVPCLFSDLGYSVRELGPRQAIMAALGNKPESGTRSQNKFYHTGG